MYLPPAPSDARLNLVLCIMEIGRPLKLIFAAVVFFIPIGVFILILLFCIIKIHLLDEPSTKMFSMFHAKNKKKSRKREKGDDPERNYILKVYMFSTVYYPCPGLGQGEDKVDFYSSIHM